MIGKMSFNIFQFCQYIKENSSFTEEESRIIMNDELDMLNSDGERIFEVCINDLIDDDRFKDTWLREFSKSVEMTEDYCLLFTDRLMKKKRYKRRWDLLRTEFLTDSEKKELEISDKSFGILTADKRPIEERIREHLKKLEDEKNNTSGES